jgi:P-type E1-E2 ATPase
VQTLSGGIFEMDKWRNLRVGDVVKIFNKQLVPADLILLATSNKKGDCFIETKNLDGETNLKARIANSTLGRVYNNIEK